nr:hypothetical protein [Nocardia wallacei]
MPLQVGEHPTQGGASAQTGGGCADFNEFLDDAEVVLAGDAQPGFALHLNGDRFSTYRDVGA